MTTLTGPSYKMAVLLDLMQRYPDKFLPGTDYVASFGVHDDFPGYTPSDGTPASPTHVVEGTGDRAPPAGTKPPESIDASHDRGGCHKTEMTHSEQITDTSSLNMFYNDELFSSMVLGTNFFRVAGLESKFAAPPLCRHDPETPSKTDTKGWTPPRATVEAATANAVAQSASPTTLVASSATAATATTEDTMPKAPPSWIAPFVVVASGAGLIGLLYVTSKKKGAADAKGGWGLRAAAAVAGEAALSLTQDLWADNKAAAEEEGMAYRLQTGNDAPLLGDQ